MLMSVNSGNRNTLLFGEDIKIEKDPLHTERLALEEIVQKRFE
jgi:hypothetical protein